MAELVLMGNVAFTVPCQIMRDHAVERNVQHRLWLRQSKSVKKSWEYLMGQTPKWRQASAQFSLRRATAPVSVTIGRTPVLWELWFYCGRNHEEKESKTLKRTELHL